MDCFKNIGYVFFGLLSQDKKSCFVSLIPRGPCNVEIFKLRPQRKTCVVKMSLEIVKFETYFKSDKKQLNSPHLTFFKLYDFVYSIGNEDKYSICACVDL